MSNQMNIWRAIMKGKVDEVKKVVESGINADVNEPDLVRVAYTCVLNIFVSDTNILFRCRM